MKSSRVLRYLALAILAFVFAFPLIWMLSYSLRPIGLPPPKHLQLFAPPYAFENYLRINRYLPVGQYLSNSLQVVAVAVPLTIVIASWAGLALAQVSARVRRVVLVLSLALLLVPAPAVWVPRFIIYNELGLTDSLAALIAPALMGTSPFYILLFFLAFARVPLDVYDSARLDGANVLQVWYLIALPLARHAVIAVAVLSFAVFWSNYADPLLYLHSPDKFTLPVGIQLLQQAQRSNFPVLMAASVIMVAPVIFLFAFAQRYFLQGEIVLARWLR